MKRVFIITSSIPAPQVKGHGHQQSIWYILSSLDIHRYCNEHYLLAMVTLVKVRTQQLLTLTQP